MNSPLPAPRMRAALRRAKAGGERFLGGVLPGATARRLQTAAFADEWAAANLDARQATGPLWIVLGDSASQGIGATTRESGYVGVMHQMLRRRDAWRVINLSRTGAGVLDVLARQLPELASLITVEEPALVTCLIGAEDMARHTPGLDTALRQVISSLPTGSVVGLLPHGPQAAGALNSVIREESERHAMRIAVLPPRLPGTIRGRDGRPLGDVGHATWARAVLSAADGPVAVAAPATDPRLPIVPPRDTSPPTDPRMPIVPARDTSPPTDPRLPVVPPLTGDATSPAGVIYPSPPVDDAAETDRLSAADLAVAAAAVDRRREAELAGGEVAEPEVAENAAAVDADSVETEDAAETVDVTDDHVEDARVEATDEHLVADDDADRVTAPEGAAAEIEDPPVQETTADAAVDDTASDDATEETTPAASADEEAVADESPAADVTKAPAEDAAADEYAAVDPHAVAEEDVAAEQDVPPVEDAAPGDAPADDSTVHEVGEPPVADEPTLPSTTAGYAPTSYPTESWATGDAAGSHSLTGSSRPQPTAATTPEASDGPVPVDEPATAEPAAAHTDRFTEPVEDRTIAPVDVQRQYSAEASVEPPRPTPRWTPRPFPMDSSASVFDSPTTAQDDVEVEEVEEVESDRPGPGSELTPRGPAADVDLFAPTLPTHGTASAEAEDDVVVEIVAEGRLARDDDHSADRNGDRNGADSNGADSNGADSNGADSNGADSNGADRDGADSNGERARDDESPSDRSGDRTGGYGYVGRTDR